LRVVAREEHTVLGKNRMASGQEEGFEACAVSSGNSQEGSVLLAMFLSSRPCSDSISALPTSAYGSLRICIALAIELLKFFVKNKHGPTCGRSLRSLSNFKLIFTVWVPLNSHTHRRYFKNCVYNTLRSLPI
jgi:hypothetical protein